MVVTVISAPFTTIFPFIGSHLHSDFIAGQLIQQPLATLQHIPPCHLEIAGVPRVGNIAGVVGVVHHGINTFGSVETVLHGIYGEELIVRFNRPTYVRVWFKVGVTLSRNVNPPTNYVDLIKEQIMEKMGALGAGEDVIPQKFNIAVSGIDYVDVWLFSTTDAGTSPTSYNLRSVPISPRERAVTDESRIEVVLDG